MHWSIGAILIILVAFVAGAWFNKNYPGVLPLVG